MKGDSPYPRKPWTFSLKVSAKTSRRGGGITERASASRRRRDTRAHVHTHAPRAAAAVRPAVSEGTYQGGKLGSLLLIVLQESDRRVCRFEIRNRTSQIRGCRCEIHSAGMKSCNADVKSALH